MEHPQYLVAQLHRALAEDPRTAELGVQVTIRGDVVALDGEVNTPELKRQIEAVVREQLPDSVIHNDIHVTKPAPPADFEELGPVTHRPKEGE
ncbi:BON domain-containing protein [Nocardia sp. NPDC050710]|uniref:BON domain-containing protein n=1 Tax=Nocardia sp. NPDC050710 TaxID=3157220 RepID=UPI0033DF4550